MPTKEELYEIYKRLGGNKPPEELKTEWTMLSGIYYLEKEKENEQ